MFPHIRRPPYVNFILTETAAQQAGLSIAERNFMRRARLRASMALEQAQALAQVTNRPLNEGPLRNEITIDGYRFYQPATPFTAADDVIAPRPRPPPEPEDDDPFEHRKHAAQQQQRQQDEAEEIVFVLPPNLHYQRLLNIVRRATNRYFTLGANPRRILRRLRTFVTGYNAQRRRFVRGAWPDIERAIMLAWRLSADWVNLPDGGHMVSLYDRRLAHDITSVWGRNSPFQPDEIRRRLVDIFTDENEDQKKHDPWGMADEVCNAWRAWVATWRPTIERMMDLEHIVHADEYEDMPGDVLDALNADNSDEDEEEREQEEEEE